MFESEALPQSWTLQVHIDSKIFRRAFFHRASPASYEAVGEIVNGVNFERCADFHGIPRGERERSP